MIKEDESAPNRHLSVHCPPAVFPNLLIYADAVLIIRQIMIMFMRMCNGMSMCCFIMCMSESVLMFMHMMSDQGICNNKCRSCSHDRQRSDIHPG